MDQIDARTLLARLQSAEQLNLLDVREVIEYHTYNIGGKNVPLPALQANIKHLNYNKADEIIVICKVGLRSETARLLLLKNGYLNVKNLAGGLIALHKIQ